MASKPSDGEQRQRPAGEAGTNPASPAAGDARVPGLDSALAQAVAHHQGGRLERAEALYRHILQHQPGHGDALHLLGLVVHQSGRPADAIELIGKAIELNGRNALYRVNLGIVLRDQGEAEEALACFDQAIALAPDRAEAHYNRGTILHAWGDVDEAVAAFRRAVDLKPDLAEGHNNLGAALMAQNRIDEAVAAYRKAVALKPDLAETHNNLGIALMAKDEVVQAVAAYRRSLSLKPDHAEAHDNLGIALRAQGQVAEAVKCHEAALRFDPASAKIYTHLGTALRRQSEYERAADWFRAAIKLQPDYDKAYLALSEMWFELKRLEEAGEAAEQAALLNPDSGSIRNMLLLVRQTMFQWQHWEDDVRRLVELSEQDLADGLPSPIQPFLALSMPLSAQQQHVIAKSHADGVSQRARRFPKDHQFTLTRRRRERLRIAYLSADFHDHATAHLIRSLFGLHDRKEFEIYAYSFGNEDSSEYRKQIDAGCDRFMDIAELPSVEAARRINADGIDIAVDLKGYTQDARSEIFALRPAPIQVNYLGYPGTMGAEFIDYIITDQTVTPSDQQPFFSEKFVYLPHSYQVTDRWQPIADTSPSRAECGLPDDAFVFCCFNSAYKIEPMIFEIWMRILKRVPGSVLWLFARSSAVATNLQREAAARGVTGERLVFAQRLPKADHLARHRHADLFLDTHIYNAHTTAADALWAGLPLITCPGETFASRVAASLLRAVGLPELILKDLAEYEDFAVRLAVAPHELQSLRQKLAAKRLVCPHFDTERFARALERAYRMMWEVYAAVEPPRQLVVPDAESEAAERSRGTSPRGRGADPAEPWGG